MAKQGIKHDAGKPALDLIDPFFEMALGEVLTRGAIKYEPDNWRKGMALSKIMGGVLRHLNAIRRGEFIDPEWGFQHASHAACGVMFLFHMIRTQQINIPDDRFKCEPASRPRNKSSSRRRNSGASRAQSPRKKAQARRY